MCSRDEIRPVPLPLVKACRQCELGISEIVSLPHRVSLLAYAVS